MARSGHCRRGFEYGSFKRQVQVRPIVVDFLGTLFATFCIGVATALVLSACVMLMAGEARGAPGEPARAQPVREKNRWTRRARGRSRSRPRITRHQSTPASSRSIERPPR